MQRKLTQGQQHDAYCRLFLLLKNLTYNYTNCGILSWMICAWLVTHYFIVFQNSLFQNLKNNTAEFFFALLRLFLGINVEFHSWNSVENERDWNENQTQTAQYIDFLLRLLHYPSIFFSYKSFINSTSMLFQSNATTDCLNSINV